MSRPDAATVADAMNARPLPYDEDGGEWESDTVAMDGLPCDACARSMPRGEPCVTAFPCAEEMLVLCLPCAMADVQAAHAAADPHCTCPDCILSHEASEVSK